METLEKPVKFLSKYRALKIVRVPIRTREIEGQIVSTDGNKIVFEDGVYETTDPAVVAYLEARPEFASGVIVRVPGNVKDVLGYQAEREKTLEQREAELAAREAALEKREKGANSSEEGARVGKPDTEIEGDGLDTMKRADLLVIADELAIPSDQTKVGTKNADIVALIRAKRAELGQSSGTGESTGGDEGGAAF